MPLRGGVMCGGSDAEGDRAMGGASSQGLLLLPLGFGWTGESMSYFSSISGYGFNLAWSSS